MQLGESGSFMKGLLTERWAGRGCYLQECASLCGGAGHLEFLLYLVFLFRREAVRHPRSLALATGSRGSPSWNCGRGRGGSLVACSAVAPLWPGWGGSPTQYPSRLISRSLRPWHAPGTQSLTLPHPQSRCAVPGKRGLFHSDNFSTCAGKGEEDLKC